MIIEELMILLERFEIVVVVDGFIILIFHMVGNKCVTTTTRCNGFLLKFNCCCLAIFIQLYNRILKKEVLLTTANFILAIDIVELEITATQ